MNQVRRGLEDWFSVAFKLAALLMPVVLAMGGWLYGEVTEHDQRITVIEQKTQAWRAETKEDLREIKDLLTSIDSRLRNLEARR